MNFIKDIKVAHKLALIGIMAFIATVVVGFIGYTSLKSAKEDIDELYKEHTMSIYYCAKVRYNTRYSQIQAGLQPYTIAPDRRQDRVTKFNNAMDEAEQFMQKYEALNAGDSTKAALAAKVRQDFDAYRKNATQLMTMNAYEGEDERAPMNYYQASVMPLAVTMGADLGEVQERDLADAEAALANLPNEMQFADYDTWVCYFAMSGDDARKAEMAKRYFESGIYSENVLRYSYNEMQGMADGGIYISGSLRFHREDDPSALHQ